MKKLFIFLISLTLVLSLVACGSGCSNAIELMGAGDKIHDSYTFANVGTKIKSESDNVYNIYGSVEKLENENVKSEFEIVESVTHIVAIKICAKDSKVVKEDVEIYVNGVENYDAEHLNGSTFTYVLLEAVPDAVVNISVKWNKDMNAKNYIIKFAGDLELK